MTDSTELAAPQALPVQTPTATVGAMLQAAVAANLGVEGIKALAEIYERQVARQAESDFNAALAKFQSECPVVTKSKKVMNKDGRSIRYRYAPFEECWETAAPHLRANGFSVSFDNPILADGKLSAVMEIRHVSGHKERRTFAAKVDKDAYMNDTQKDAAAISFAKRQVFVLGLGLRTEDPDNDAATLTAGITKEQIAKLNELAEATGSAESGICEFCGVTKYEEMSQADYGKASVLLEQKLAKQRRSAQ